MKCFICQNEALYTEYRCKNCYCNSSTDKELDKYLLTEWMIWKKK